MKQKVAEAIAATARILKYWLPLKILYDHIPGLSVGITHHGKLVYKQGFGYANIEGKKKTTLETGYRIASISKVFTSIAILQLVEAGKLRLDDPVTQYLPWFRVETKRGSSKLITIRQLLSHTAGVFRDGATPHWVNDKFPTGRELKNSASKDALTFETLTQFKYSNFGFALLGEIIRRISGLSYQDYVTKNIIQRLKLQNTAVDFTKEHLPHLATGYSRIIPHEARQQFPHVKTNAYAPATGFVSNVPDLAKLLTALSPSGSDETLVNRLSKKEMMKEQGKVDDEGEWYGLGLRIYRVANRKIVGHSGGFPGFNTRIALALDDDIGVITLSNTNEGSIKSLNSGILETIFSFLDTPETYHFESHNPFNASNYEGVYRSRWGDQVIVGAGGILVGFDPTTNSPLKERTLLRPAKKNQFTIESKDNFDSIGEKARFLFDKRHKKTTLLWGAMPLEKLSYQAME